MEEEKTIELWNDFIPVLEKLPYIQELKKRIEVGNLELNLSFIQKELQRQYQFDPNDEITKYKLIWFSHKYFSGSKGIERLRTVNNLIMDDLPMGEELRNRANSQKALIDFLVENGKSIEELKELNEIDSITDSRAIRYEKNIIEDFQPTKKHPHFTCSFNQESLAKLLKRLKDEKFLPTNTPEKAFNYVFGGIGKSEDFEPLCWIKTNSTTHGKVLSKRSLLNLLELLKIPHKEIIDKNLLNRLFVKPDGTSIKFTNSNYTNTQKGFNSEYNNALSEIVNSIK